MSNKKRKIERFVVSSSPSRIFGFLIKLKNFTTAPSVSFFKMISKIVESINRNQKFHKEIIHSLKKSLIITFEKTNHYLDMDGTAENLCFVFASFYSTSVSIVLMYICEARYKYTRMDKNKIHSISDWFSVYRDDIKKKKKKIRAVYHSSVYKDEKRKKMKKEWKNNWNNCTKSALTMIVICWNVSNRSRVGRKRRKMKYTSFLSRIIPIKKNKPNEIAYISCFPFLIFGIKV